MKKDNSQVKKTLEEKFKEIYHNHDNKVRMKSAKVVLGSSVIRALKKGIKESLKKELSKLTIKSLIGWAENEKTFRKEFERKSQRIKKIIGNKKEVRNGKQKVNKHAHAPKILALYCRELLGNSWESVNYKTYKKIEKLLFCPIDGIVIKELRKLDGGKEILGKIDSMKRMEEDTFIKIQEWLMEAAKNSKVPRIWFDDVWAEGAQG